MFGAHFAAKMVSCGDGDKDIEAGFLRFAHRRQYGCMIGDGACEMLSDGGLRIAVCKSVCAVRDEAFAIKGHRSV